MALALFEPFEVTPVKKLFYSFAIALTAMAYGTTANAQCCGAPVSASPAEGAPAADASAAPQLLLKVVAPP